MGEKNEEKIRHGEGTQFWGDGSRYDGQWDEGYPHGTGTFRYKNGDTFEGNWVNGNRYGEGKYTTSDSVIKGIWKDEYCSGVEKTKYGQKYNGEFFDR